MELFCILIVLSIEECCVNDFPDVTHYWREVCSHCCVDC